MFQRVREAKYQFEERISLSHQLEADRSFDQLKTIEFQAQVLNLNLSRLLWINTYLPTDPITQDFDEKELVEVLSEVESLLNLVAFDDIVWNGDLNSHPDRKTGFSQLMTHFLRKF